MNKARKQIKTKLKWRKEKKSLEWASKQKLLGLILTVSLDQIYSQSNKKIISNLKTQRSRSEKAPIRKYWLEDVLWKTPHLIHYF